MNDIWGCWACSQISELFHTFKGFISSFYSVIYPSCRARDVTVYLAVSVFTFSPISSLATTKFYLFFFIALRLPSNILTLILLTWRIWWAPNNADKWQMGFNPLNSELNPICYLLALLAHHFLHVSRISVKSLILRLLMSYIYGAPILDVSRSYTTTHHSR